MIDPIPSRAPKYAFGEVLVNRHGFRGKVRMMFVDFKALLAAGIVGDHWLGIQTIPPSTTDQIFYILVGDGAVIAGENDVYSAGQA